MNSPKLGKSIHAYARYNEMQTYKVKQKPIARKATKQIIRVQSEYPKLGLR